MECKDYKLVDFLADEDFVFWVKDNSHISSTKWNLLIKKYPQIIPTLNEARQIILTTNYKERGKINEKDYNYILNNLESEIIKKENSSRKRISFNTLKLAGYAATLAAVVLVGLGIYFSKNIISDKETVAVIKPKSIIKSTQKGQKSTITLQDGTTVKLNAESKLRFAENFGSGKTREVYLEGEAFFDVKIDTNRPFNIHTKKVVTTVLGTSFNIKVHKSNIQVAVATGKVKVHNNVNNKSAFLLPKEKISVKDTRMVKTNFDYIEELGWKDNIIYFKNADFEEVVEVLEKWYGVEFILTKNINGIFNGTFKNLSLKEVLEGINYMSEFKFKIENDKVYIN